MLQLENRIIDQRIGFEVVENFKETHAADAFAEKTAQHRILGPDVAVVGRNMLHDIVGGRAQDVFRGIGLMFGDPRRADVGFEELHRVGDLLHQACERGAHQCHPQTPEQLQQRTGRAHDRIGVGRNQFVDAQQRPGRRAQGRRQRCRRRRYPFFRRRARRRGCITRGLRRIARGRAGGRRGRRVRRARRRGRGLIGMRRLRQPPARIGTDDRPLDPAEGICRFVLVGHGRSSRIAQR